MQERLNDCSLRAIQLGCGNSGWDFGFRFRLKGLGFRASASWFLDGCFILNIWLLSIRLPRMILRPRKSDCSFLSQKSGFRVQGYMGFYRGYIGIMEKKMETTNLGFRV